jgi:ATP-dependent Clp protease ATP-binding subunit ClpA
MLSRNLEMSLRRALALANGRQHELATLEHLLMALVDDEDAAAVLEACAVEVDRLRAGLNDYLDHELTSLVVDGEVDAKPTAGFQRVIQRAAIHVQSSGRSEVTGANVLAALFSARESHPVFFLQEQNMSRLDAINYISHGIAKRPGTSERRRVRDAEEAEALRTARSGEPLLPCCANLERTLEHALALANARRHEYATREHLLMALIDDEDARTLLTEFTIDFDRLRAHLNDFLDHKLASLVVEGEVDAKLSAGVQLVMQRAAVHAKGSGRKEVTGAEVLMWLYMEGESHASLFLREYGTSRGDVIDHVGHGTAKSPGMSGQ